MTVSARNYRFISLLVVTVLVVLSVVLLTRPSDELKMGSASFVIERADTQAARAQGLSNRDSLPANQSLLFVFDESERHCFWMKDMRFPIDMIWINDEKRVVHIEQSVKPESYPESFCPPSVARYVIEVNAGQVSQSGITAGDTVSF